MLDIERTVLDMYPTHLRAAYRAVLAEHDPKSRHKLLLEMTEAALERLTSLAFSTYRNQSWSFPSRDIETFLQSTTTLSLGKYADLMRRSLAQTDSPAFDVTDHGEMPHAARLGKAIQGIQEAIDLEAAGIVKIVRRKLEQTGGKPSWLSALDQLISYRNKSEGHARTHQWPVSHVDYFSLMTPLLEEAVVELVSQPFVVDVMLSHCTGNLRHTRLNGDHYDHVFDIEDQAIPLRVTTSMEQSESTLFPSSAWSGTATNAYLLQASGHLPLRGRNCDEPRSYRMVGLFHDLATAGVPSPIAVPETPQSNTIVSSIASSRSHQPRTGTGTAAGTCGELVQGFLGDGTGFHITSPISKSSTVTVHAVASDSWTFTGSASTYGKLCSAIRKTAETLDAGAFAVDVSRHTDLDVGKGMGSSTADILAGSRAMALALESELTSEDEARIAVSIESSDGTMFPGLVAFGQKTGVLVERFEWWPRFAIVMVVPDATLNTESVSFHGKERRAADFERIIADLRKAAADRDGLAFAQAASRSAELNQSYVPNEWYDDISALLAELESDGICVAHTGTIIGALFLMPADDELLSPQDVLRRARAAKRRIESLVGSDADVELVMTPQSPDVV